ncbi:MAG: hypothetical protein AAGK78_02935 [Planctomycetota bacterium]
MTLHDAFIVDTDGTESVAAIYRTGRGHPYVAMFAVETLRAGQLNATVDERGLRGLREFHRLATKRVDEASVETARLATTQVIARNLNAFRVPLENMPGLELNGEIAVVPTDVLPSTDVVAVNDMAEDEGEDAGDDTERWKLGYDVTYFVSFREIFMMLALSEQAIVSRRLRVAGYVYDEPSGDLLREMVVVFDGPEILLLPATLQRDDAPGPLVSTLVIATTPVAVVFDAAATVGWTGGAILAGVALAPAAIVTGTGFLLFDGVDDPYGKWIGGYAAPRRRDFRRPTP